MYLIAGCGYVGERVADLLHELGHPVAALTHSPESAARLTAAGKPYPVHVADLSHKASLAALSTLGPEAILHCASSSRGGADAYRKVYVEGCRNLLAAFPDARLVFTSSTSVYPQTDGSVVTEESDASPDRETSRLLREAEDLVLVSGGAVARLAGIYGPGRSFVLKAFLEGTAVIEGNEGQGRMLNQIHRDDAARALAHLLRSPLQGIYNVVDDSPMTQRECFLCLVESFGNPMPPVALPNKERKRAWTHKYISNAKLRQSGWSARYPSYLDALHLDADLAPSILAQVTIPAHPTSALNSKPSIENPTPPVSGYNIVLVGLMGGGKTTVGRLVAHKLGFGFVDTDHLICESAGRNVGAIFETEGETGFRTRETDTLRSLAAKRGMVIATGGGIVTQAQNLPLLKELGFVVWLSAEPSTLHRRTCHSHERPLLHGADPEGTLRKLFSARSPLYEAASDLKIQTDDLTAEEVAYGISESAKLHFRHLT